MLTPWVFASLMLCLIGALIGLVLIGQRARASREREQALRVQIDKAHARIADLDVELSTTRQDTARRLLRCQNEAAKLEAAQRDLVANVSHEIKTPLTAVRGYAETLQDGALDRPEVARRFTERILEQCRRMEVLLGDLLSLSGLESHPSPVTVGPTDLVSVARDVIDTLAHPARIRGVDVVLEPEKNPLQIIADRDQIERLLINLIDNAIKYNQKSGEVRVRLGEIGPTELEGDERRAMIEIRDTGIGIPDASRERIFERFYRVDKGRARDQGGSGLGLSIAQQVVASHGGEISVESQIGEGSTFRILLPLQPAD